MRCSGDENKNKKLGNLGILMLNSTNRTSPHGR